MVPFGWRVAMNAVTYWIWRKCPHQKLFSPLSTVWFIEYGRTSLEKGFRY